MGSGSGFDRSSVSVVIRNRLHLAVPRIAFAVFYSQNGVVRDAGFFCDKAKPANVISKELAHCFKKVIIHGADILGIYAFLSQGIHAYPFPLEFFYG